MQLALLSWTQDYFQGLFSMRKILFSTLMLLLPAISMAQFSNSRAQSWDFSLGAIHQFGHRTDGPGGSYLDVRDSWGFGFYTGYNFNDHFALGADFDFVSPGYSALLVSDDNPQDSQHVDWEASQFNGRLKGTINLLEGPWVPYVEAGFGWTYIDSNVASGPPTTGCWWHPWWGYICSNYFDTFSGTEFSYGVGVGLRYELRGNTFLKLSYNYWEIDADNTKPVLESARLEYGWRF